MSELASLLGVLEHFFTGSADDVGWEAGASRDEAWFSAATFS